MQVTARSERDITPEVIVQKVSEASGSKYSASTPSATGDSQPPQISSKPAFTPTRSSGGVGGFNPLANSKSRSGTFKDEDVDEDGWGQDAPQVTRTQLEKVQSSYQPTKINMRELSSQKPEPSRINANRSDDGVRGSDIIKGSYQPVGKVDIGALRRQAQEAGQDIDDRPTIVKGSYEPVGKVDIAAIRARAQKPGHETDSTTGIGLVSSSDTLSRNNNLDQDRDSFADRSAPFSTSERLTSLPKPKVGSHFGSGSSAFTGTKAPTPGTFGSGSFQTPAAPPLGVGRTFADQAGKTPAQIWAEKKGRQQGIGGSGENQDLSISKGNPLKPEGGEWKSGYDGKTWAPVQTTRTGQTQDSLSHQKTGQDTQIDNVPPPTGGIEAIKSRFKDAPTMGLGFTSTDRRPSSPPPLDTSSKPNASRGFPLPGLPNQPSELAQDQGKNKGEDEGQDIPRILTPPPQPPRSPTPPTPPPVKSMSPIRVAMPVGRGHEDNVENAREEQFSPPPAMPTRSLAQTVPHEDDLTDEPTNHDPARRVAEAAAISNFNNEATPSMDGGKRNNRKRALVQYDYEKAESNELELKEGEYIVNIDMVDDDWWMGQNMHGETGLFPSNYVELVEDDHLSNPVLHESDSQPVKSQDAAESVEGHTATALYEYEAAEDNELSFPEDAQITDVVSVLQLYEACEAKCYVSGVSR